MRPHARADALSSLRANAPARLSRRLDAEPSAAEAWSWTVAGAGATVNTDGGETVTVGADPAGPEDLTCTCLLSPRCFHILAVAAALPTLADAAGSADAADAPPVAPGEAAAPPPSPAEPVETAPPEPAAFEPTRPRPTRPRVRLDGGQQAVLGVFRRLAADLLATGAASVGDLTADDLARAIHSARAVGLHRLARAGRRVRRHLADLQQRTPQFRLATLVEDFRDLATVAIGLGDGEGPAALIGIARAEYRPVPPLRLHGVCTEPVIAATGLTGVATLLLDTQGRPWTISDVQPGGPSRAVGAYEASAGLGGVTTSHRELGRSGLFVQDATASPGGRLGTGGGIRAARAQPSDWSAPPIQERFARPLRQQLDEATAREDPDLLDEQPAEPPWLFVEGVVCGRRAGALILQPVDGSPELRLVPPTEHAATRYRENLDLLARAPGLGVRCVGRAVGSQTLAPAAIGPLPTSEDDTPRLTLPPDWAERCNLGYDLLVGAHLQGAQVRPNELSDDPDPTDRLDPLAPLARRAQRLLLGGRATLPGEIRATIHHEARALNQVLMPTAAQALLHLAEAAAQRRDPDALLQAWLNAARYLATAGGG